MKTGLVSVSFRPLSYEPIIEECVKANLGCIEWGSDVHAPCDDTEKLKKIAAAQQKAGLVCSSYGTYFRLGTDDLSLLPVYIEAAKVLGTHILRLWCGSKSTDLYTEAEKDALFAQCRQAAAVAEKAHVIICLECHRNTFTETKEGALELMEAVASPAFRMYWQPNQGRSIEENLEYARLLSPYITHIHVFQWKGSCRFPLREGIEEWKSYLAAIGGEHTLLLEFMPDDSIASLSAEAAALFEIAGETNG